jgi:4-hydroxy-tetrahydrodipicolinate reductase
MAEPLLLLGYGRMGRLVAALAPEYGFETAGHLTSASRADTDTLSAGRWPGVEVAVDFSTAEATVENLPRLARAGLNAVVGTTGWQAREAEMRRVVEQSGIGVVVAANFSPGVNVFEAIVERAAALMAPHAAFGAWIHELHHAAKRDAPSGTALALRNAMERGGYTRAIDVASTRAGSIPGTHTVGFDGPAEAITLTHATRDRATFARGALMAARWVIGRRGWFSMRDVLGLQAGAPAAEASTRDRSSEPEGRSLKREPD